MTFSQLLSQEQLERGGESGVGWQPGRITSCGSCRTHACRTAACRSSNCLRCRSFTPEETLAQIFCRNEELRTRSLAGKFDLLPGEFFNLPWAWQGRLSLTISNSRLTIFCCLIINVIFNCRSLIKVKLFTDQVRPAVGSVGCLVVTMVWITYIQARQTNPIAI